MKINSEWNDDMDQDIVVSVIMPAYNCARYIKTAIDSVLIQNVPLELIIINDCSKDHLEDALKYYLYDSRVRVLNNEKNLGVAKSRNRGVQEARGKYVAFLDADDQWLPGKLEKQLKLLEKTGFVLCCTARELMKYDGTPTGQILPANETITYRDLKLHNQIGCSSVVMKTEVAREFPMHHDDGHEDYLMWLEVLEKYGKCCAVNEPLLRYRMSSTGKSGTKLHSAKLTFRTYRYKGYNLFESCIMFMAYAISGCGKYLRAKIRSVIRKSQNKDGI